MNCTRLQTPLPAARLLVAIGRDAAQLVRPHTRSAPWHVAMATAIFAHSAHGCGSATLLLPDVPLRARVDAVPAGGTQLHRAGDTLVALCDSDAVPAARASEWSAALA